MLRTALVVIALSEMAGLAKAEVIEFAVDPVLTRWSMRGTYFTEDQQEGELASQFPGSETTSLTGVVRVDLTPTTIQFLPGTFLDAVLQPLPQQPGVDGAPGTAVADYGMAAPTLPAPAPVFAARDFRFTLSSPPIPLIAGQFQEDLEATVNVRIDYDLGTASGALTLSDWIRGFDDDNVGRITTAGGVQTLELQNYLGDIFALQSPADSFFEWSGPIIATRVIPEPSGLALAWSALCASAGIWLVRGRIST